MTPFRTKQVQSPSTSSGVRRNDQGLGVTRNANGKVVSGGAYTEKARFDDETVSLGLASDPSLLRTRPAPETPAMQVRNPSMDFSSSTYAPEWDNAYLTEDDKQRVVNIRSLIAAEVDDPERVTITLADDGWHIDEQVETRPSVSYAGRFGDQPSSITTETKRVIDGYLNLMDADAVDEAFDVRADSPNSGHLRFVHPDDVAEAERRAQKAEWEEARRTFMGLKPRRMEPDIQLV